MRHRLLSRIRAVGLTARPGAKRGHRTAPASARTRRADEAELVDEASSAAGRGRGPASSCATCLPMSAAAGGDAPASAAPLAVTFLAPLDPLVWDRRPAARTVRLRLHLGGVRARAPSGSYGYYVLPILFGDRLVGRIEPRLERRAGRLAIAGVWFEPGFEPMEEPHFIPRWPRRCAPIAGSLAPNRRGRARSWAGTWPGRSSATRRRHDGLAVAAPASRPLLPDADRQHPPDRPRLARGPAEQWWCRRWPWRRCAG